jgi:hypothetical protein
MNRVHTHYDNLNVSREAPPEVIRAAYRALCQKFHPDRNPGDANATRIMGIVNAAYEVLSDPTKRRAHDEWIRSKEAAPPPASHASYAAGSSPQSSVPPTASPRQPPKRSHFRRHVQLYASLLLVVGMCGALSLTGTAKHSPTNAPAFARPSRIVPSPMPPPVETATGIVEVLGDGADAPGAKQAKVRNSPFRRRPQASVDASLPSEADLFGPATGTELIRGGMKGLSSLKVSNGTDHDAVVNLLVGDRTLRAVYIGKGRTWRIPNVAPGSYRLRFAIGKSWNPTTQRFVSRSRLEFLDDLVFEQRKTADDRGVTTYYSNIEITLHVVQHGNAPARAVDDATYEKGGSLG